MCRAQVKMEIHVHIRYFCTIWIYFWIYLVLFGVVLHKSTATANILGRQYDPDRIWENVDMASLGGVLSLGSLGVLGSVALPI